MKQNKIQNDSFGLNTSDKIPIIIGKNVSFSYSGEKIFESVNFEILHKEFLGIIGPNGGGKTTFIKILLGLLPDFTGEINYPNRELFANQKEIGYVPQNTQINVNFPIMVIEIVEMGILETRLFGYRVNKQQKMKAIELLSKLGIENLAYKKISDLSGGQRQRVFIARALIGNPKLLILDEPTSNIDMQTQIEIYKILKTINEFHTIITISHDIPITLEYATRVLHINRAIHIHETPYITPDKDREICDIDIFQNFSKNCIEGR